MCLGHTCTGAPELTICQLCSRVANAGHAGLSVLGLGDGEVSNTSPGAGLPRKLGPGLQSAFSRRRKLAWRQQPQQRGDGLARLLQGPSARGASRSRTLGTGVLSAAAQIHLDLTRQ